MPLRFYADVHIPRAIVPGLRLRGVDVLTAQDDQACSFTDPMLLDRATGLGRVLFSFDTDLLKEASRRQEAILDEPLVIVLMIGSRERLYERLRQRLR